MRGLRSWTLVLLVLCCALAAHGDDLAVGGNPVTSSEVWVNGARERSVTSSPAGNTITLRQCDLKRTVTVNEQNQAYVVAKFKVITGEPRT